MTTEKYFFKRGSSIEEVQKSELGFYVERALENNHSYEYNQGVYLKLSGYEAEMMPKKIQAMTKAREISKKIISVFMTTKEITKDVLIREYSNGKKTPLHKRMNEPHMDELGNIIYTHYIDSWKKENQKITECKFDESRIGANVREYLVAEVYSNTKTMEANKSALIKKGIDLDKFLNS